MLRYRGRKKNWGKAWGERWWNMLKQINDWCKDYWYIVRVLFVAVLICLFLVPPVRNGIFELLDLPTRTQLKNNDFAHVEASFARVDARFAEVDARFAQVDARFEYIDLKFDYQNKKLDLILGVLMEDVPKSEIRTRLYEIEVWYNVEMEKLNRKNW
jgi:hypothetical protein